MNQRCTVIFFYKKISHSLNKKIQKKFVTPVYGVLNKLSDKIIPSMLVIHKVLIFKVSGLKEI